MTFEGTAQSTFAITTPLYYVNDLPHIGSAYPTMAADAIARFQRLRGYDVRFITGSDEHGQKIQRTAESLGRTPQAHCDQIVQGFDSLWKLLNIRYDRFIRTTESRHAAIVREFFQRVWDNGDIYLSQQKGWYCVSCEEFKDEKELLDGHRCPIHVNKEVEWRDEENYFFRLSKYQDALEKLYAERPEFIQPETRRNEVLSFVKQGLRDFSISRVNFDWGFPVPADPHHIIYVWFDALLGYITALLDDADEPTLENALKHWWPIHTHIIGKDILRFHAVYWPAMLMSAGLPLPHRVFGHGFIIRDGVKIGKSTGNAIDPVGLTERYGADAMRYYFLKELKFGQDGSFEEVRFVNTLNADLADNLGNLLNRTLKLAVKNCQGAVPDLNGATVTTDNPLKLEGQDLCDRVTAAYEALAFHDACEAILNLVRLGNRYIDDQAPWKLYKSGEREKADQVLYVVLESVRLAAYLLSPITPSISTAVYQQLGYSVDFSETPLIDVSIDYSTHGTWGILTDKQPLGDPKPVFQKLELPDVAAKGDASG
ncbi:methionine--tRNA ligase [Alkalinema sp. FACHB-956]|uniref:methionine--tRNA ligase n=1 Tax=Alkalinema sp. FACHB-956 TaxID=2692768 RepID=UPI0016837FC0|nr:methionine--tRNA ligase [Alkalinema sp. FACHB-956]MBD2328472.1 methionine--tRNA ligase [Alkalinema sp. FACHB-956]